MISVCLPTHNGSKYIIQQLNSIICQLKEEDEIIISDDSSEDNTCELIQAINDKRIKIYREGKFSSYVFNFENAIKHARGDHIFLCDQDDVWVNNKVYKMLNALQNVDLVVSDCYVTDSFLNIIHYSYYKIRKTTKSKLLSLIGGSPYLGCCMAFNRNILDKVLPFPKSVNSHDIWIGNIAAFYFKIKFIDDKLIYYRRHDQNISTIAGTSKSSFYARFADRFRTIINLFSRL
ncbi:MAG TPA: glycosyltransferase [Prolixibacteraceae bacterium]|nr:glycosyltransferase [Prolixibacteraceae bacterium]